MKKILLYSALFAIAILIIFGVVNFSKTSEPALQEEKQTVPLETYTNTEYGFSFSYPSGYTAQLNKKNPTKACTTLLLMYLNQPTTKS